MAFTSEKEMVEIIIKSDYIRDLTSPGPSLVKEEVKGLFGIPDIVVVKNDNEKMISYAFEAKLTNWKRALIQAFRYKAFVNQSYVIMDHDHVKSALSQTERFSRSNIGLMSIDNNGTMYCHHTPHSDAPYSTKFETIFSTMVKTAMHNH
ncbi:hypothetical protein [Methanofollis fontis]|nr:hypothetical protein [Methanofollis fontis]